MNSHLLVAGLIKAANPTIDALIPANKDRGPFGGMVSDAMMLPEAHRRSGRLNAMQEAQGQESPRELSHPLTTRALTSWKGTAAGGLLGGALGAGLGGAKGGAGADVMTGAAGGALAGAGAGSIIGLIVGMVNHRRAQTAAAEQIRANGGEGADVQKIQPGSPWAGLMSGMHQTGKADTAEALATGKSKFDKQPRMTAAHLARALPFVGPLAMLGQMGGSAVRYGEASNRLRNAQGRQ